MHRRKNKIIEINKIKMKIGLEYIKYQYLL